MSKTPRTDAEFKLEAFFDGAGIIETVPVEFACQLETELADKEKQLAEARAEIERKDKLIEQMREALDATDEYYLDKSHAGKAHNTPIVVKVREAQAALAAAERINK